MSSPRLQGVFRDLAEQFDYVIVDTAAVDTSADVLVLGRAADAVLIVARAFDTRYAALGALLDEFGAAEVPRLGVVLNAYPRKKWLLSSRPRHRAGRSSSEVLLTGRRHGDVAAGYESAAEGGSHRLGVTTTEIKSAVPKYSGKLR